MNPTPLDMSQHVCLITGGTSGIGKTTALGLARLGATLILVGRDSQRGTEAVKEIRDLSQNQALEFIQADLSLRSQVRRLAQRVLDSYDQLHVLVNNAGVVVSHRRLTAEGVETTFAINHLAPFLLTELLLNRLEQSAPARIVNVASGVHWSGKIVLDDLQGERGYRPFAAYSNSKLANILFTRELARRLEGTEVTANCLHPGMVRTRLVRQGSGAIMRFLWLLAAPLSISATRGARTSIYLASSPEVAGVSGEYFAHCRPARSSALSQDEQLAGKLWELSAKLTSDGS